MNKRMAVEFRMDTFPRVAIAYSEQLNIRVRGYTEFLKYDGFSTVKYLGVQPSLQLMPDSMPTHSMSHKDYTWFVLKWG